MRERERERERKEMRERRMQRREEREGEIEEGKEGRERRDRDKRQRQLHRGREAESNSCSLLMQLLCRCYVSVSWLRSVVQKLPNSTQNLLTRPAPSTYHHDSLERRRVGLLGGGGVRQRRHGGRRPGEPCALPRRVAGRQPGALPQPRRLRADAERTIHRAPAQLVPVLKRGKHKLISDGCFTLGA